MATKKTVPSNRFTFKSALFTVVIASESAALASFAILGTLALAGVLAWVGIS